MGGGGALDAVELDDDDALGKPGLVGFRGRAAGEKAPAGGGDRRRRQLRVGSQGIRIGNRMIARHPISVGHYRSPLIVVCPPFCVKGGGSLADCRREVLVTPGRQDRSFGSSSRRRHAKGERMPILRWSERPGTSPKTFRPGDRP